MGLVAVMFADKAGQKKLPTKCASEKAGLDQDDALGWSRNWKMEGRVSRNPQDVACKVCGGYVKLSVRLPKHSGLAHAVRGSCVIVESSRKVHGSK